MSYIPTLPRAAPGARCANRLTAAAAAPTTETNNSVCHQQPHEDGKRGGCPNQGQRQERNAQPNAADSPPTLPRPPRPPRPRTGTIRRHALVLNLLWPARACSRRLRTQAPRPLSNAPKCKTETSGPARGRYPPPPPRTAVNHSNAVLARARQCPGGGRGRARCQLDRCSIALEQRRGNKRAWVWDRAAPAPAIDVRAFTDAAGELWGPASMGKGSKVGDETDERKSDTDRSFRVSRFSPYFWQLWGIGERGSVRGGP